MVYLRSRWSAVAVAFVLALVRSLPRSCVVAVDTPRRLRTTDQAATEPISRDTTEPFWIGHRIGEPSDTACYRKTYPGKQCPRGYEFDNVATCWAQCPMEYPVECGMECIPQNQACSKAVLRKVASVVTTAMNVASAGVFGKLVSASKLVKKGVDCSRDLLPVVQHIVDFVEAQGGESETSTTAQIRQALAEQSFVTEDLPVAVSSCLGLKLSASATPPPKVAEIVELVVDSTLTSLENNESPVNQETFFKLLAAVGLGSNSRSTRRLRAGEDSLAGATDLMDMGVSCGRNMKSVVDKIVAAVQELQSSNETSTSDADSIRYTIMNSDLFLQDLPDTALKCVDARSPDAFKKRDQILTTMHTIVDHVLDGATKKDGTPMSSSEYTLSVADMGLDALSTFDPTGLADMAKEFVQPVCGPTIYTKAIDAGPADEALGLRTMETAFDGSSGQWTTTTGQKSPGKSAKDTRIVHITFKSGDDKDVTVQIKSGGNDYDKVKVEAGETVSWSKPLMELQGKTLYMVRSRPGFLGIKGKGGGSLLVWVPEVKPKGNEDLSLEVRINSPSDHASGDEGSAEDGSQVDDESETGPLVRSDATSVGCEADDGEEEVIV